MEGGGLPDSGFPPGEGAAAIAKSTHLHISGGKRTCGMLEVQAFQPSLAFRFVKLEVSLSILNYTGL